MASASTPSAKKPAKDLILLHTVQLKPMIKAHFSGRMVSSGISDVVFASVHSEKTSLKKLPSISHWCSPYIAIFVAVEQLTSAMKLRPKK